MSTFRSGIYGPQLQRDVVNSVKITRVHGTTAHPTQPPNIKIDSIAKAHNSTKNSRKLMKLRSKSLLQYVKVIYEFFFGVVTAESGLVSNLVPDYSLSLANVRDYFLSLYCLLIPSSLPLNCNLLLPLC